VDFKTRGTAIPQAIAAWVREKTHGKIEMALGAFGPDVRLVLVNAIYFLGKWLRKFETADTSMCPFYWKNGTGSRVEATVSTMKQTSCFEYAETKDIQVLAMPYSGGDFEMVVFLPRRKDTLPSLEDILTGHLIEQWRTALKEEIVRVLSRFLGDDDRHTHED
jgi:serine protease inhibitor